MTYDRIAKLTPKEREVLRLVNERMTSKEIAPLLNIGVDAVDGRIKNLLRKLGMSDRGKAARLLAEYEREHPYPQQVYLSPDIAEAPSLSILNAPRSDLAREAQQAFIVEASPGAGALAPAIAEEKGARNELSSWQRIALIAAIAIGTVLAIGVIISALNGLFQLALEGGQLF